MHTVSLAPWPLLKDLQASINGAQEAISKRRKWKEPCASIYTRELLQAERADPYPTHTTAPVFSITQVKDLECKDSPQPQSFIINISLQVQIPMKSDSPGRREGQGLAVSLC